MYVRVSVKLSIGRSNLDHIVTQTMTHTKEGDDGCCAGSICGTNRGINSKHIGAPMSYLVP